MDNVGKIVKEISRSGPFKGVIANGIKAGDMLYLSGQVSVDDDGNVLGAGDIIRQMEEAYHHVADILSEFGANMDNIVDEIWLVTDMQLMRDNFDALTEARENIFGKRPDVTQTAVQVAGLVDPEWLIEIRCTAYLPS